MFKNLFIIALLIANVAIAQQPKGKVVGKIVDATNNQPLSFASVSIFKNQNAKDSLVGGTSTTETGIFTLKQSSCGQIDSENFIYWLSVY